MGRGYCRIQRHLQSIRKSQKIRPNHKRSERFYQKTKKQKKFKIKICSLLLLLCFFYCDFLLANDKKIKIHNETERFVDIEASVDQLHIDVSILKKENSCLMGFDIFDGETAYSYYYRRPRTIKDCKEEEKDYMKMLKGAKTFRIVGVGFNKPEQEPIPKPFRKRDSNSKKLVKSISLAFERLQVGQLCKSYFDGNCDPKNYWSYTTPPPNKKIAP